jgi:hypothetical protein
MIGSLAVQPISRALPGALAELMRAAPLSPAKVQFAWKTAVGAALDRASHVRLEGTELHVDAATGQWARELTRAAPMILSRLQALLGPDAVTRLDIRNRP